MRQRLGPQGRIQIGCFYGPRPLSVVEDMDFNSPVLRLFFARSAAVVFGAAGLVLPKPCVLVTEGVKYPRLQNHWATAALAGGHDRAYREYRLPQNRDRLGIPISISSAYRMANLLRFVAPPLWGRGMGHDLISTVSTWTYRTAQFVLEVSRLRVGRGPLEIGGIAMFLSRAYVAPRSAGARHSSLRLPFPFWTSAQSGRASQGPAAYFPARKVVLVQDYSSQEKFVQNG